MSALFENFFYPLVIMVSVPMAAAGGFLGLFLVNRYLSTQPLDILTRLGFVILVGIVVNNAILIVHQSLNFIREQGMDAQMAIKEAVRIRTRPIFMSTTTSIFGMIPLVFFPGAGSELYRGLGSVVIGGLAVSTIFTLFLIPSLFSLVYSMGHALRKVRINE
jgi:HAE1 family hydrophobic/amphiphilic exporter-1